jgi:imidazolonepropionase-like amidohydrolase
MVIRADRVISHSAGDGHYRALLVRDGRIEDIVHEAPSFPEITLHDFDGCVITPCFCDYHLHFSQRAVESAAHVIDKLLSHGITRAYESGDLRGSGIEMKKISAGKIEMLAAGYGLFPEGGYGKSIGKGIRDAGQARSVIDALISEGINYLKILHSGIYDPESDRITAGGFAPGDLAAIIAYARGSGLAVFCHANGARAVSEAVQGGVSAIVHGLHVSDDTLSEMAEKKIAFIPTLYAFQSLHRLHERGESAHNVARALDRHMSAVGRAHERGVRVLPGSDAGPKFIPYGEAFLGEMRLLLQSGVPYDDVIRSAAVGPLQQSHDADFLILEGLEIRNVVIHGNFLRPVLH